MELLALFRRQYTKRQVGIGRAFQRYWLNRLNAHVALPND